MVFAGGCASGSLYKAGEGNGVSVIVILSISVTQALFADVAGWTNKLVPASWHESAVSKGLAPTINAGDGWVDQYLAGYVWDQPVLTYASMMGMSDHSVQGAFLGNVLVGVVIPAALLLVVVYIIWSRKSFMRKLTKTKSTTNWRDDLAGYWAMISASRRTAIAGLILGVFCGLQMLVTHLPMLGFQVQRRTFLAQQIFENCEHSLVNPPVRFSTRLEKIELRKRFDPGLRITLP